MLRWPLALALVPCACFTYPCDTDVLGCEEGDEFVIDRSCTPTAGTLTVELRESGAMQPLGAWPELHHGVQGGIHYALGLELVTADVDHREFRIEVTVRDCEGACTAMDVVAERTLVVDDASLAVDGDALALDDIVVLLDREPRSNAELVVTVTDSCGRTVEAARVRGTIADTADDDAP